MILKDKMNAERDPQQKEQYAKMYQLMLTGLKKGLNQLIERGDMDEAGKEKFLRMVGLSQD